MHVMFQHMNNINRLIDTILVNPATPFRNNDKNYSHKILTNRSPPTTLRYIYETSKLFVYSIFFPSNFFVFFLENRFSFSTFNRFVCMVFVFLSLSHCFAHKLYFQNYRCALVDECIFSISVEGIQTNKQKEK